MVLVIKFFGLIKKILTMEILIRIEEDMGLFLLILLYIIQTHILSFGNTLVGLEELMMQLIKLVLTIAHQR
ncbi:MAG: hypothetical protein CMJ25_18835 [Phycisphaerae bacterium]|nr:hypothetical protein [Phycisphaerae bacterium]